MADSYSPELAERILSVLHEKGWNVYESPEYMTADGIIREKLVSSLEMGGRYTILPAADDPTDPKQVFDALDVLAQRFNGEMPTIQLRHTSCAVTGFTLREDGVKTHTPEGIVASYSDFLEALDSLAKII